MTAVKEASMQLTTSPEVEHTRTSSSQKSCSQAR
jgi:hypothetical protein